MGKVAGCFAALLVVATLALVPARPAVAQAQSTPTVSCSGTGAATPMQGHYTGPWHSDGDYHFTVFNTDLELKITIDGTMDVTVGPSGAVSGKLTGNVNAPIYDYGKQDISSGIGTISGPLTGQLQAGSVVLVLQAPVIDMHWGTFGGHAVERFITMPDYQFPISAQDCISLGGTIAETNFPVQNVVADGTGNVTQAPGIGAASGTWQLSSDAADAFHTLSQQVDSFISSANAWLSSHGDRLAPASLHDNVVAPLQQLEGSINQHPDAARCLLERLGAWEASVVPGLLQRAQHQTGSSDVASLRRAADLLRAAHALNLDCGIDETAAASAVHDAELNGLDAALLSRNWPNVALLARELVLLQGEPARATVQSTVGSGLRNLLGSNTTRAASLEVGRLAYVFGDSATVNIALRRVTGTLRATSGVPAKDTQARKRKKRRKPAPRPAPATPEQVLMTGLSTMTPHTTGGAAPTFSWTAVPGAQRYLIVVRAPGQPAYVWSWSGSMTSVTFGDTTLSPGDPSESWPIAITGSGYHWSVLALDGAGHVMAASLANSL